MSESKDYAAFKKHCAQPLDRIDRIENIMVTGMPDINYCMRGVDGWIELKSPKEPKRETTALFSQNHKVTQEQKNWFLQQRNAGGSAYFLIATDKRWMLIHGNWADSINEMTVNELVNVSMWHEYRPVKKPSWSELRCKLANSKTRH